MGFIGQIIIGILMIIGGVLLLKSNYQVANTIRIGVAEQYLGNGGSYLLWKILAVLLVLVGLTVVFGFYDNILGWILSPVESLFQGAK